MVVLYDRQATSFQTLGLGTLTDFLDNPEITEGLNGEYYLEFEYSRGGKNVEYILEDNLIKSLGQVFRIENVQPSLEGVKVLARHIVFDLRDNFLIDVYPQNLTAQEALKWLLDHAMFTSPFSVQGDCVKIASARYERTTIYDAIFTNDNALLTRFGGELEYDNYNIIVHQQRGVESNLEIREKKNLKGLDIKKDFSNVKTRLMPVGSNGIVLPEKFIDSPLINNYPTPKIGKLEVQTDTQASLEEQYNEMRKAAEDCFTNGDDKPTISMKVDFIELSRTKEYENYKSLQTAHLGDTVRVYVPSLKTNLKVRIIKTVKSGITGEIIKLELGNEIETILTSISKNNKEVKQSINEASKQTLESFKQEATDMLNHPFGGHLYISEDTGELFIMDTTNPETATQVWKWGLGGLGFSNKGINGPYETAWTQDGKFVANFIATGTMSVERIEGLSNLILEVQNSSKELASLSLNYNSIKEQVSYFDDQAKNIAQLTLDVESIKQEIGSITDTTTSGSGVGTIFLDDVLTSELLYLQIYPTKEDLSYLYPNEDLEPAEDLEPLSRDLLFINRDTKKTVRWTLPCDLLYISDTVKDELIVDYENSQLFCIHRVGINSSGKNYALASETTEYFDWQSIVLEDGDYDVKMESFTSAYIYARTLAQNLYTEQFATRVELNSSIELLNQSITLDVNQKVTLINKDIEELDGRLTTTATEIKAEVSKKVDNESFSAYQKLTSKEIESKVSSGSIISTINQSSEKIKIDANKLELSAGDILDLISGNTINLESKNITISSDNFNASGTNFSWKATNSSMANDGKLTAKNVDLTGKITATSGSFKGKIEAGEGTIGGWTLTSDTLYNNSSGISSNTSKFAFWAGESNEVHGASTTNAKFKVGHDGSMIATGATVSGSITATTISCTNGTFAGWKVTSNGLSGDRLNLNSIDGAIEIYPASGGKILFNNGIRLAVPKGVMITSSSNGDRTAPSSGDVNVIAGLGKTVYLASRSGDRDNDSEYQCITISRSSVQANWQNIATSSSRATKENITMLEKSSIDEIYNLVRNLDFYQYDYKKNYSGRKDNVGFLIEDIEGTILEKYLHVYKSPTDKKYKNYNSEDLTRILLLIVQQLQKQIEELRKKVME